MMIIPNIWEKKNVPNHQPVMIEVPQSTNMWGSSRRTWLATLAQHIPWGYHVNGVSTKETSEATKKIKLRSSLLCETVCKVRVP